MLIALILIINPVCQSGQDPIIKVNVMIGSPVEVDKGIQVVNLFLF